MKKSLLIALFAVLPVMAQDAPQKPECASQKPCCRKMVRPARPQLTEEQKAEMKAKFMEKFDTDKDGKISDAEKEAIKAEFKKNAPKFRKHGRKGPRFHRGQRPCNCKRQK
jgi:hypothetical protein